jgi:O-antigen/teichoic acid export membrane protein
MATALFLALGTCLQFHQLRRFFSTIPLRPLFRSDETRLLLRMGIFVWMQELGAVVFGQLDRILLGVSLGALAVAPYSLCVQFAQPIFGLNASGLHFLFPYLAGRASTLSGAGLKQTLLKAFCCNLLLVACGAGALLLLGYRLIRLWAGATVAQTAAGILTPIILGSALMGLSVTGTYAMQALGRFREVALISLASRTVMLVPMVQLLHHMGLQGLAVSRLCYGLAALLVYLPLLRQLTSGKSESGVVSPLPLPYSVREEVKP